MNDIEPVEMEVLEDDSIDKYSYSHCGLDSRRIFNVRNN